MGYRGSFHLHGVLYHKECIEDVICNPKKYDSSKYSLAVEVLERKMKQDKQKQEWKEEEKKQAQEIKKYFDLCDNE